VIRDIIWGVIAMVVLVIILSSSPAWVTGIVVGSVVGLALLVVALLRFQRRREIGNLRRLGDAGRLHRDLNFQVPRDTEVFVYRWMTWVGFPNTQLTPMTGDRGADVISDTAVAEVKAWAKPVGRRDIQLLFGVAQGERKKGMFFSLSGYAATAIEWAKETGVALYTFDQHGEVRAVNRAAQRLRDATMERTARR
jgi:hypothetical protein